MSIDFKNLNIIRENLKQFPNTKLLIVTKNQSVFDINTLISEGYKLFGENRVQEAQKKFSEVNNKIFPLIKLKNKILEFPSTPIIVNAANEILVDHFLNKKLQFLGINKIIMSVLNDRNYKKYAIRIPNNINHIIEIDKWARKTAEKYVL